MELISRSQARYRTHMLLFLALALSALLFSACSNGDDDDQAADLTLTVEDNGGSFDVSQGDRIRIELASNPTTGFEWAVDNINPSVLRYEGAMYEADDTSLVGQGGTQRITFQAINPGESVIQLKYWRSWEGDDSVVDRFEITVSVDGR
jgi:inhibitor of cysteine peptidase